MFDENSLSDSFPSDYIFKCIYSWFKNWIQIYTIQYRSSYTWFSNLTNEHWNNLTFNSLQIANNYIKQKIIEEKLIYKKDFVSKDLNLWNDLIYTTEKYFKKKKI